MSKQSRPLFPEMEIEALAGRPSLKRDRQPLTPSRAAANYFGQMKFEVDAVGPPDETYPARS